ncbi:conserved protein of unknown function [Tenacibaculum sp. 190524A02b]|uniref:DUF3850 domain-containing protein n=1 Tax=Tenacibaculum vairaonense TaxID=3137860 RepID=UPI0032B2E769
MNVHDLKIYPEHFNDVVKGTKKVEIRKNDRNFQVGDILYLNEYCPLEEKQSLEYVKVKVTHILHGGQFGLNQEYVAMSITLNL